MLRNTAFKEFKGEFALWACAIVRDVCRCQALHGRPDAVVMAVVMQNIHIYYKQFQHLVQETLQKGLGPIEKHLKVEFPAPQCHVYSSGYSGFANLYTALW